MRNLLFMSICALTTTVFSANYYVSNAGNDSNNGVSPATAWKTLANVNSRTFQPGDSILFKRGDEWNGERLAITASGTLGNPITYSAYGTGEKPVFNGISEVSGWKTSGNWTNMGSNVWRINSSLSFYTRIWINSTERERSRHETEGAGVTAQYPWQQISNIKLLYKRLYVYSASNPADAFSSLKTTNADRFINTSLKNYITIQNLDIQGWAGCRALGCSNWIWEYCDFSYNFQDLDLRANGATPSTNGIIRYCNFDNKFPFFTIRIKPVDTSTKWIYIAHDMSINLNHGNVWDWDVHHNSFINCGYAGVLFYSTSSTYPTYGIKVHHNYYNGKNVNYGRLCLGYVYQTQTNENNPIEVYNNRIDWGGVCQFGIAWLRYYNNVHSGSKSPPEYGDKGASHALLPFNPFNGMHPYEMKVYNNVFHDCEFAGSYWVTSATGAGRSWPNMRFNNNIFYNCGWGGNFRRAQFVIDDWMDSSIVVNPQIDNNIFWSDNTTNVIRVLSQHMTVTQFNALNGNNIHELNPSGNLQVDPLFVDPANGDFRLQAGSPAIGAGLTPISATDAAGNAWNNPPSIGPYEYSVSTRVSESSPSQTSPAFKFSTTRGAIVIEPGQSRTASIEVTLYDGRGRRVSLLHGAGGESLRVETKAFAPGVYTMQILIDGRSYTRRIAVGGRRQLRM